MESVVLFGAGALGEAIIRRIGAGRQIILADRSEANLQAVAKHLEFAGYRVSCIQADISQRSDIQQVIAKAQEYGEIKHVVNAAGVSPSQASIETIIAVDLIGTAMILEEFGKVIAPGGSGIMISSQSGHRLPALGEENDRALAMTSVEKLAKLELLDPKNIKDPLEAYQLAKRANVLRVAAQAVEWSKRHARINAISPGIVMTPLAVDELNGPRGDGYKKMFEAMVDKRPGTPDEIADLAEFLMSRKAAFITGGDILMDGGVTAKYWYGEVEEVRK